MSVTVLDLDEERFAKVFGERENVKAKNMDNANDFISTRFRSDYHMYYGWYMWKQFMQGQRINVYDYTTLRPTVTIQAPSPNNDWEMVDGVITYDYLTKRDKKRRSASLFDFTMMVFREARASDRYTQEQKDAWDTLLFRMWTDKFFAWLSSTMGEYCKIGRTFTIELVDGIDIATTYRNSRWTGGVSSCMNGSGESSFRLYTMNPDVYKLLRVRDSSGSPAGRMVVTLSSKGTYLTGSAYAQYPYHDYLRKAASCLWEPHDQSKHGHFYGITPHLGKIGNGVPYVDGSVHYAVHDVTNDLYYITNCTGCSDKDCPQNFVDWDEYYTITNSSGLRSYKSQEYITTRWSGQRFRKTAAKVHTVFLSAGNGSPYHETVGYVREHPEMFVEVNKRWYVRGKEAVCPSCAETTYDNLLIPSVVIKYSTENHGYYVSKEETSHVCLSCSAQLFIYDSKKGATSTVVVSKAQREYYGVSIGGVGNSYLYRTSLSWRQDVKMWTLCSKTNASYSAWHPVHECIIYVATLPTRDFRLVQNAEERFKPRHLHQDIPILPEQYYERFDPDFPNGWEYRHQDDDSKSSE